MVSNNFLLFTPIWGRFPFWLWFFEGVGSTTNQVVNGWFRLVCNSDRILQRLVWFLQFEASLFVPFVGPKIWHLFVWTIFKHGQWSETWFPIKGDRYHIILQLAVYTAYIPLIVLAYWVIVYHRSHLLSGTRNSYWHGGALSKKSLSNIHHDPEDNCWWQPEIPRPTTGWMVLKPVVNNGDFNDLHLNWWTPDFWTIKRINTKMRSKKCIHSRSFLLHRDAQNVFLVYVPTFTP